LVYKTNIFNILYRVPIMKEALIVEIHSVIWNEMNKIVCDYN
jgi:hypothetical protein